MRNQLTHPLRLPLIAPSILSADFANMGEDCRHVLSREPGGGGGDILHIDVMDGHFVPNLTMGPDMCKALRKALPTAFQDVHLMVTDPLQYAQAFVEAGADHLTVHIEVLGDHGEKVKDASQRIHDLGISAGLALNPGTPVEYVLPYLDLFEMILVMSVNPGRSGQAFIPDVLEKTQAISEELSPLQRLEMDGGIKLDNIESVLDAGCDVVVAASAIFGQFKDKRGQIIRQLRGKPVA